MGLAESVGKEDPIELDSFFAPVAKAYFNEGAVGVCGLVGEGNVLTLT